jgi:uncharacterized protein
MKEFVINFVGLKEEKHDYNFDIDEKFFESLDYSIVEKGKIKMNMTLEKKPGVLLLTFNFKGFIDALCDRCGDAFELPVEGEDHLTVKHSPTEYDEESEDVVLLDPQANSVDVTHYIYEAITLSLPLKMVHPDDEEGHSTCDEEVIKALENLAPSENKDIDPRWDKLKSFKN